LLGEGSFGKVFKMIDTHTGHVVAVKTIQKRRLTPLEYDFMLSEIEILRTLCRDNHPLIVRMHDVFEDTLTLSIVMEYIEGQTLLKWLTEIHKDNNFSESIT
jgi:serine/threonine protein kinase